MKRRWIPLLLTACIVTFAGCSSSKKITTGNEQIANAVYQDESISLANYTGLKAEKKVYKVTEESVDDAIYEQLADYADYKSVSRASKSGDNICIDYTASVSGDSVEKEKEYDIALGDEEFGAEFDEKLTGVSKGDALDFTIDFEADFFYENFAGQTVQFEVLIRDIQEEVMPDVTDEFVKENLGYDTYKEFAEAVRESVEQEYETESTGSLQEDLLQQVIDASSILQYSKEEYDEAKANVESFYSDYADMFDMDVESIYETFDVTEESLESDILDELYRIIVVKAIIKNEELTLSDEEYEDGIAYYMEQNEYTSKKEFIDDYGEDEIQKRLLEDKVLKFLENSADITEVEAEYGDN